MKHLFIGLALLFWSCQSSSLLAQTYKFSSAKESAIYKKSDGSTEYKELITHKSPYTIVFEVGTDRTTQLVTFYKGTSELYWANQLEKRGNIEINGKIYNSFVYYNVKIDEIFYLYQSFDNKTLITMYADKHIEFNQ